MWSRKNINNITHRNGHFCTMFANGRPPHCFIFMFKYALVYSQRSKSIQGIVAVNIKSWEDLNYRSPKIQGLNTSEIYWASQGTGFNFKCSFWNTEFKSGCETSYTESLWKNRRKKDFSTISIRMFIGPVEH